MRERKYCLVKGNSCECGRNGWAIKFCRKPLSSERMAEIMRSLAQPVSVQATGSTESSQTESEQSGD